MPAANGMSEAARATRAKACGAEGTGWDITTASAS